jgi:hypothetical protein
MVLLAGVESALLSRLNFEARTAAKIYKGVTPLGALDPILLDDDPHGAVCAPKATAFNATRQRSSMPLSA